MIYVDGYVLPVPTKNLKYYDGTWHNWSWVTGSSHGKVESAATVAYCTANYEAKIGDTATC